MKEKSFRIYIFNLLKNIRPGLRMTRPAIEAVDSMVRVLAEHLVDRALTLTTGEGKKTVSVHELQTAVTMLLPAVLAQSAMSTGNKAVELFVASEEAREKNGSESTGKAQTRESRCSLIFSVSGTEKYLRRFGQVGYHVSATAPVFLAGVLQSVANYLLNISADVTSENEKVTISVRYIFLALSRQAALQQFFDHLGIILVEGGVAPQNLPAKQHKRLPKKADGSARPHRWRPGTKTLIEIRRMQRSNDMVIQHAPFNRLVRELTSKLVTSESKIRFTADFFSAMQALVEDRLVKLMSQANTVASHAGRETVYSRDVALVAQLLNENQYLVDFQTETVIPEASLRHLALRAGVMRYGECCTAAFRNYTSGLLNSYLRDIVHCAQHHGVITLGTKLMLEGLGMRGLHPTIVAHRRRATRQGNSASRTASQAQSAEEAPAVDGPELSDVEEENGKATA